MRFAEGGLYIERYEKCANCGILLYEDDPREPGASDREQFCSKWCRDWATNRATRQNPGSDLHNLLK